MAPARSRLATACAAFLLTTAAVGELPAQTTGTLLGRITSEETGAPLGGALVRVRPLGRETLTTDDGRFVLAGLPVGRHDVAVTLLGFAPLTLEGVTVHSGRTVELSLSLRPTAIEVEPLVVEAERLRLIEPEVPQTRDVVAGPELRELPVTSVAEAVELTTGVSDGHFRGGRVGQETYVVDGIAIKNQLEGSSEGLGLELAPSSLEEIEVVTGGFGAEYGSALSGVVSYVTRRGDAERWEGSATWLTDHWAPESLSPGFHSLDVNGGGPLPFLGSGTTVFADLFLQGFLDADPRARGLACLEPGDGDAELGSEVAALRDDPATAPLYCPFEADALPHQTGDKLIGFLRFDGRLSSGATLTASLLRNRFQRQLYTPELKYATNQLGQRTTGTLGTLTFDWSSHREGRALHVTARAAAQRLDRYLGALDMEALDDRTEIGGLGLSEFEFLGEEFTRLPIDVQLDSVIPVPGYRQPTGLTGSPFGPAADGIFVTDGTSGIANWTRSDFVGGDLVGELLTATGNRFRVGGSAKAYRVEVYERTRAFVAGSAPNYARFYPATLGGFLEAEIRPHDLLTLEAGLRVEGFRSGLDFRQERADFLAPVVDTDWQLNVTPRLGIAGAFRNSAGRTAFRVNFARIAQPPDFQFFIDNTIGDSLRTDVSRQGNPTLAFEEGRAFEVGFSHLFAERVGIGVALFRKELTSLVTGNVQLGGTAPGQFTTGDEGTVQGVELTLRGRWPGLQLRGGWALQEATGIASTAFDDSVVVRRDLAVEFPLAFDRRHSIDFSVLAGRAVPGRDPDAASWLARTGWGAGVTATVQSGFPISRRIATDAIEGPPEIERLPWTTVVDLRLTRELGRLPGCAGCRLRIVLDGRNVLDRDNIIALRRDSGELAPSLETVEEATARPVAVTLPIPRESSLYAPRVDLDRNGLIEEGEFRRARFAAAVDASDPSLLYGEDRQLRLGVEVTF